MVWHLAQVLRFGTSEAVFLQFAQVASAMAIRRKKVVNEEDVVEAMLL